MADSQAKLQIVIDALNNASSELKTLKGDLAGVDNESKSAASSTDKAQGAFDTLKDGAAALAVGVAAAGAALVTLNKIAAMVSEGAQLNRIETQWTNAAARMGEDGDSIVAAIDRVTGRTILDKDIQLAASRATTMGLVSNGDQIVRMFQIAQAMSVAYGGTAIENFDAMSMAMQTGMTRQLKSAGLTLDLVDAEKKYADAHHKTVAELTDGEQIEIRRNEILEQGAVVVAKVGDATNDQVSKIQRLERGFNDLTDALKGWVATAAIGAVDTVDVLANGDQKLADAFHATAAKMKQDVIDGKMSLKDYNDAITGMGANIPEAGILGITIQGDPESLGSSLVKSETLTQQMVDGFRILKKEAGDTADQTKRIADEAARIEYSAPTDINKMAPDKQAEAVKEYGAYQDKLTGAENKGGDDRAQIVSDANDELNQMWQDQGDKRKDMVAKFGEDEAEQLSNLKDKEVGILSSWAEDEQKITDQQNKERMRAARQNGTESVRAEEDYQRARQRAQEDHGRKISDLADSRDALGISDEMDRYAVESRRAQEDFQTTAARRGEDYAQQLSDLNAAAEEQRQARTQEKDKQLAEADAQFAKEDQKRQAANTKALADFDAQTLKEQKKLVDAENKKLLKLDSDLAAEQAATDAAWKQWRNEHDIYFAGERAAWDAHLKYMHDSLIASETATGPAGQTTSPTTVPTTGLPGKASGGDVDPYGVYMVGEHGPEPLIMGSRGGYVVPNSASASGLGFSIGDVTINITEPGATPTQIAEIVHTELIAVAAEVTKRQAAQR